MNIKLLTKVAEWLEAGAPHKDANGASFHMNYVHTNLYELSSHYEQETRQAEWVDPSCGSVMCIAGAALQFHGVELTSVDSMRMSEQMNDAAELLELDSDIAEDLFEPWESFDIGVGDITPAIAAQAIRHLIETGEVKWFGFERFTDED